MDLVQLRTFITVANSGGFSAAAAAMDVTPSTVTRAIANLEASLGVLLFHRTTRKVTLTDAGQNFLNRVMPTVDELDAAAEEVQSGRETISGTLRIGASVSFGQMVIARHLADFAAAHPDLSIDLILSDSQTDLIAQQIDVAVRHGALDDSRLIARRLKTVRYYLVAAPDYIRTNGQPSQPEEITHFESLTYPYPAFRSAWRFSRDGIERRIAIEPRVRVSNAAALLTGVKNGMGIALMADWIVDQGIASGAIVQLLPDWVASGSGPTDDSALWIVMPSRSFTPAKTKAFVAYLQTLI